jgi:hypothetical protein
MSKAQVEGIMGPPTTSEIKDAVIFKKRPIATEDGTFKNDELDTKRGISPRHKLFWR